MRRFALALSVGCAHDFEGVYEIVEVSRTSCASAPRAGEELYLFRDCWARQAIDPDVGCNGAGEPGLTLQLFQDHVPATCSLPDGEGAFDCELHAWADAGPFEATVTGAADGELLVLDYAFDVAGSDDQDCGWTLEARWEQRELDSDPWLAPPVVY